MSRKISKRRSPKPGALTNLVHYESGKSFTFDVFCDDEKWLAGIHHELKNRKNALEGTDTLVVNEHKRILELHDLRFSVRKIWRNENGAVLADLLKSIGNDISNFTIPVGRYSGNLTDFTLVLDWGSNLVQVLNSSVGGLLNAALNADRVGTSRDKLHAFTIDALCQNGGGGSAIACGVVGLIGDFAHHLCAHILIWVGQFDFLGDGDAVLTALGTERCGYGFG